jgi:transaldolase/glucose-6-phosphate isomerase
MAKIREYVALGQSIWLDYLRRALITSGELKELVAEGLGGVTSNPSIFEKAIDGSSDYDEELKRLVKEGKAPDEILEVLMIEDVGHAADLFRPLYDSSGGKDGYVSIEVNPRISDNTEAMIAEARRFHAELHRPNVMIKIPATPSGLPAIERLISESINVNVTLIFSSAQYKSAAQAYLTGLEKFAAAGGNLRQVSSVASLFVSRVDTLVDDLLKRKGNVTLQGKIGIANAKIAYQDFKAIFSGARWENLHKKGANVQRVLWGSTGVKDPTYPDTLYCDALIGPNTINTVPPATLRALIDHGRAARTVDIGVEEAREQLNQLSQLGINFADITKQLEDEGVAKFSESFDKVIETIKKKHDRLVEQWHHESAKLGHYEPAVAAALARIAKDKIVHRIWAHDFTVWSPDPKEINNRLGWLHTAEMMQEALPRITEFVDEVRRSGITEAVLLGMGGSSLAPQVFAKAFDRPKGYPSLSVIDTVDPDSILAHSERLDPTKTLYIVATKSGSTAETLSLMKYFYGQEVFELGKEDASKHFVAITDPASPLAETAERFHFRAKFLNDPNIGGRYSALSYFGLIPAALLGVDVARLLEQAMSAVYACESTVASAENPGAWLGAILGELTKAGRDKVTLFSSPQISSFCDWVEQLIAESTGKDGRGLLPVVGEPVGPPEVYGNDRLFVYLRLEGDTQQDEAISKLEAAGQPVVRLQLHDRYELGRQFFLWEMAVAIAGYVIRINPFDQPNVESAKVLARKNLEEYKSKGSLAAPTYDLFGGDILVYGKVHGSTVGEALESFLNQADDSSYVAILAYLKQTPETDETLTALRSKIRNRFKVATTVGYGPRYLHSTGQLHKGDAGRGLFLQITAQDPRDVDIPDEMGAAKSSISFSVLKQAEAIGDYQALVAAGRRIIRFHMTDVNRDLVRLNEALAW